MQKEQSDRHGPAQVSGLKNRVEDPWVHLVNNLFQFEDRAVLHAKRILRAATLLNEYLQVDVEGILHKLMDRSVKLLLSVCSLAHLITLGAWVSLAANQVILKDDEELLSHVLLHSWRVRAVH
jgi:hypothetical protein